VHDRTNFHFRELTKGLRRVKCQRCPVQLNRHTFTSNQFLEEKGDAYGQFIWIHENDEILLNFSSQYQARNGHFIRLQIFAHPSLCSVSLGHAFWSSAFTNMDPFTNMSPPQVQRNIFSWNRKGVKHNLPRQKSHLVCVFFNPLRTSG